MASLALRVTLTRLAVGLEPLSVPDAAGAVSPKSKMDDLGPPLA